MGKILSIIIPTYNMEKYLRKCLDSLIVSDDNMKLIEVLVINDGSKDSSSQIAHEYENKFPNTFKVIDKENGNYGSCVNRGLKEAMGKYVKVLDADDYFDTKSFEFFISFLIKCNSELILTDFKRVNEFGKTISIMKSNLEKGLHYLNDLPEKTAMNMWMHSVTYTTESVRKIHYKQTEGISYTDQEWIFLPFSAHKTWEYCPIVLYNYLNGRDGQTVADDVFEKNFWMELKGMKVMLNEMKHLDPNCSDAEKKYLVSRLKKRAYNIYIAYYKTFKTEKNLNSLKELDYELSRDFQFIIEFLESIRWIKLPIFYLKTFRKTFKRNKIVVFVSLSWRTFTKFFRI